MVRQLNVLMQESDQMRKLASFNKFQGKEGSKRENDNYFIERNIQEIRKPNQIKTYENEQKKI